MFRCQAPDLQESPGQMFVGSDGRLQAWLRPPTERRLATYGAHCSAPGTDPPQQLNQSTQKRRFSGARPRALTRVSRAIVSRLRRHCSGVWLRPPTERRLATHGAHCSAPGTDPPQQLNQSTQKRRFSGARPRALTGVSRAIVSRLRRHCSGVWLRPPRDGAWHRTPQEAK